MLTCKEVTTAIASDELATAGWRRTLAVRLHLLMCRHCRRYAAQIRTIGRVQALFESRESDATTLDRLERAILEDIHEAGPGPGEDLGRLGEE